jgi:flagellar hook-basal body complex protein FliE
VNSIKISGSAQVLDAGVLRKTQATEAPLSRFSDALSNAVNDVNKLQQNADKSILNIQSGNTGSLHEAMIALEKADISFRTMLQVRNKLLEAYQQIMTMQV